MQRSAVRASAGLFLLAVLCAAGAAEASSAGRHLTNARIRGRRAPRVAVLPPRVDNFVQQRSYLTPMVATAGAAPVPLQQLQPGIVAAGYVQQRQPTIIAGAQRPVAVVGQPTIVAGARSIPYGQQATYLAAQAQPRIVAAAPQVAAGPPINAEFLSLRHNLGSKIHAAAERWWSRLG